MLAAGLDGILNKIEPPHPLEENIFALTEADLKLKEVSTLPASLREAIDALEADPVISEALGSTAMEAYTTAKRAEWRGYSSSVSQWELENYLEIY